MCRNAALALTVLALASQNSFAVDNKHSVYVTTQCEGDSVGERIAYKVREGIRRSASMTVADSYTDSVVKISIVCIDPYSNQVGSVSRYSYAITTNNTEGYYDFLLTHGVGSCGSSRVDECAEGLVADIDTVIIGAMKRVKDGTFRYKHKQK